MTPNIYVEYSVSKGKWEEYADVVLVRLKQVVLKSALDIKALVQYNAPVDQGAAKASIYVTTEDFSDQSESLTNARTAAATEPSRYGHKGRDLQVFDDVDEVSRLHALICVGVVYGLELEFGGTTVRATNPGAQRPYLTPAFEEYHDTFLSACAACFSEI